VKLLLETGKVNEDMKDEYNMTPLWRAASNGHAAVVELLLSTGKFDVNSKDTMFGDTPLSCAAKYGHESVVKLLLEAGSVDEDLKQNENRTPL
jgi:ankyrin repeat protein